VENKKFKTTDFMAKNIHLARDGETVGEYLTRLRNRKDEVMHFHYVYVADAAGHLVGVVRMHDFLTASQSAKMAKLMDKNVIKATPHKDPEHVAMLAIDNDLKAVPIVDDDGKFIGIVPESSLYKILRHVHVDEFLKMAGINKERGILMHVMKERIWKIIGARLPWLFFGLAGGMFTTEIVKSFQLQIERQIALAFFMPIIVYMADAVGTQTEALFMRTELQHDVSMRKYLAREGTVGFVIGAILGACNFIFAWLMFKDLTLSSIVGLAMFATVFTSVFVAIFMPYILIKLKRDPGIGSGPFATIIQDTLSIIIYFLIASWLL
jgi:magnesium transporter